MGGTKISIQHEYIDYMDITVDSRSGEGRTSKIGVDGIFEGAPSQKNRNGLKQKERFQI